MTGFVNAIAAILGSILLIVTIDLSLHFLKQ